MDITLKGISYKGEYDDSCEIKNLNIKNNEDGLLYLIVRDTNLNKPVTSSIALSKSEAIALKNIIEAFISSGKINDDLETK